MNERTVLITGAGGFLGAALRRSMPGGVQVIALDQRGPPETNPDPAVRWVVGDLGALESVLPELGSVELCIHAAAIAHQSHIPREEVFRVNRDSTLLLAERLAEGGALRRFLFVSTIAVLFGEQKSRHKSAYAEAKLQAEQGLAGSLEGSRVELSIARLATLYGSHDSGNVGSLVRGVTSPFYFAIGKGQQRKALLWVDAAAECLWELCLGPWREDPVSLRDPYLYSFRSIEEAILSAAGR
ncbi:NAD-dependent epimerase/dehydratase family protein, partial [Gemmatimonadota bacterium]